jgi:hypothetical protein
MPVKSPWKMPSAKFSTVTGADLKAWLAAHNATVTQFALALGCSGQHAFRLTSGAYDGRMPYGVSNLMELVEAKPEVLTRKYDGTEPPWQPTIVARSRRRTRTEEQNAA